MVQRAQLENGTDNLQTVCKLIIVKLQPMGIGNITLGIPRSRHQECPRVLVSNLGIYQPHVPRCQRRRVIFISNGFTEFPQLIKLTRFGTRLSESGEHGFDVQDIQQRQWSGIRRINHSTPSESFHADDCEESTSAFKMRRNCRVLLAHRLNGCFANGLLCHGF